MSEVFVSYKRENLAAVGRLVEGLRAEGIGVWWDQDIPPNAAWEATIEHQLSLARVVLVAWSPASVASENVKAEARWARTQGRLLQVFVEACAPPLFFGERQGVDLKHWSGDASDPAFQAVLEAVRKELRQPSSPSSDATAAPGVFTGEAAAPALPTKPSIAVLPFANLSGDPEQEYFADGMVAEITTALSRFRSIFVIASGSGLSFKGKGLSPQEAARQLGVRYVLEGSVRKAGGRVRISVQLIDAADGAQLWAERFDDTLEDVFALQDRVALSVAGKVDPTVQQAEIRRASARPTDNMGSYELYLRAHAFIGKRGEAEVLAGLEYLNRAIALDPDFGQALGWAAFFEGQVAYFGWTDDVVGRQERALRLANRALTVAGDDPQVIATTAIVYSMTDIKGAGALLERAIALNPGSSLLWIGRAYLQVQAGEPDLAVESVATGLRLDPVSPHRNDGQLWLGVALFEQARFDAAVAALREARDVLPTAPAFLAACLGHLGQTAEAREALSNYRRLTHVAIDDLARVTLHDPTHLKLFLDGIALAEGKSLSGTGGDKRP